MSTLELEHLKHSSAGSNAITLASNGSLTLVGNASASGTLAVTGDLTVDTNVFHVDAADNRVGIGTTTPTVDLEILGASSRIKQINSSGHQVNYGLWDGANYRIEGDANRPIVITSYNTSTSGGIKMGISGGNHLQIVNGGYVTMPNQPAFKIGLGNRSATGSDRVLSTNAGDTFSTGRDAFNIGSHWNSTTGRFTAPVAGTYVFYCSLMRYGTNGSVLENRIKKNGGLMWARVYAGGYHTSYQSSILFTSTVCAVGDYIEFFVQGTVSMYQDDTYIGGYLLG